MSLVLIVDDHRDTGRLLVRLLRAHGHDALAVDNGQAALAFVNAAPTKPSLVLLDVMMPEMNGFDTLEALRQIPGAANLPVVMFTALEGEENVERAKQLGAKDYWIKGTFEPKRLIDLVATHGQT